jgi:hypothetical protein
MESVAAFGHLGNGFHLDLFIPDLPGESRVLDLVSVRESRAQVDDGFNSHFLEFPYTFGVWQFLFSSAGREARELKQRNATAMKRAVIRKLTDRNRVGCMRITASRRTII